jgi:hypothetical protein
MPSFPPAEGPANFRFVTAVGDGPEAAALAEMVDRALEGLPGPWSVGVCRGNVVAWVILSIFRDDGFECSLFLDEPLKQTALYVREQLQAALRLHDAGAGGGDPAALRKPSS